MRNIYNVTFITDYETVITTVAAKNEYDAMYEAVERLSINLLIPRNVLRAARIEVEQTQEDVTL